MTSICVVNDAGIPLAKGCIVKLRNVNYHSIIDKLPAKRDVRSWKSKTRRQQAAEIPCQILVETVLLLSRPPAREDLMQAACWDLPPRHALESARFCPYP